MDAGFYAYRPHRRRTPGVTGLVVYLRVLDTEHNLHSWVYTILPRVVVIPGRIL